MKHIFFAYPAGRAGMALLLMRVSLVFWLSSTLLALEPAGWVVVALSLIIICLGLGYATRIAAALCGVGLVVLAWPIGAVTFCNFDHALIAAALALIGPGGSSLDALLFGRRTIRLSD